MRVSYADLVALFKQEVPKMRMISKNLLSSLFLIFCVAANCLANDSLKEEFLRDAPPAWRRYLASLRTVEETVKESSRFEENGELYTFDREASSKIKYPYQITKATRRSSDEDESITTLSVVNSKYRFSLVSDAQSPEKWKFDSVEKIDSRSGTKLQFPTLNNLDSHRTVKDLSYENQVLLGLADALKIHSMFWFPSVVSEKDFEIVDISESEEEGRRVVSLTYRYEPDDVVGVVGPVALRSGQVWMYPDSSWTIKKASFDLLDAGERLEKDRIHVETTVEYRTTRDDYPLPQKITTIFAKPENAKYRGVIETEYSWNRNVDLQKKECRLSYYGFPEPKFKDENRLLRPVLVFIGLVFIFVAGWLALKRRKAEKAKEIA